MLPFTYSRTVEPTQITYALRGTLDDAAVDTLIDLVDSDLDKFDRIVRLDVTGLVLTHDTAKEDLLGWVQGMNIEGTNIEVVGTWPHVSSTRSAAPEPSPRTESDRPPGMFSVGEPPIERKRAKQLTRFCSIRYFRQMYPYRHYPLAVVFADRVLETIQLKRVEDLSNIATLLVDTDDPVIEIRAVFPGCITIPEKTSVDLTADKTVARFWVTPISLSAGELKHAYVEIWYQGRLLERIATPATIARQKKALLSFLFGVFAPALSFLLKFFSEEIKHLAPDAARFAIERVLLFVGHPFTLSLLVVALVTLSLVAYLQNTPREAVPVRSSLSI